ncbi:hypothetical protein CF15_08125 [Pyrodictium occultum]|uniref:PhoU domain-containing protein n=1 Tax=Pyrodictium occultum TaxID=2309 RepID=A0A0V8RRX0_PYROC|nr:phosphate uptake regulator PhoU [Pyrodictium occultum]KSW10739.1 hypothetical protein CF15_08125 [Pyrodictium occultum]
MTRPIELALSEIGELLDRLFDTALASLDTAMKLVSGEESDAGKVESYSREAARLRQEVIEKTVEALARFQPVASDLRRLTAYMEASYDLFRVSRYALEIARLYGRLPRNCQEVAHEAPGLRGKVEEMLSTAYVALQAEDPEKARSVILLDEEVDRAYVEALDRLAASEQLPRCEVARVLLLRHLERIADHAVYIASAAHYVATGERLEPS